MVTIFGKCSVISHDKWLTQFIIYSFIIIIIIIIINHFHTGYLKLHNVMLRLSCSYSVCYMQYYFNNICFVLLIN